ncbi:MAG: aldehyde dehydrogenase family protein, partial [Terracidiphilus sp.]|nr:aldehyde dehydrogenase family protein [Terracidiphilus sp.]
MKNFVGGEWVSSAVTETLQVLNPASVEVLAEVPLSTAAEVHKAAEIAAQAWTGWRRTPVV